MSDKIQRFSAGGRFYSQSNMAHAPQEIRTFFVTSVTNRRHPFFKSAEAAELLIATLYFYRAQGRFQVHEFVIMPDHFHLIITPEERIPLEKAVQYIKGGYATSARRELGLSEVWQPKPTNHRIRDAEDYEAHRDYIFDNPVRAGLAPYPEDYAFSSARRRENLDSRPPALKRKKILEDHSPRP
ncbi:MAG TPA: transposase [Candidatus Angelobacter sp.]|nr:transposase [Candidatus Angelobacter sp.]